MLSDVKLGTLIYQFNFLHITSCTIELNDTLQIIQSWQINSFWEVGYEENQKIIQLLVWLVID